MACPWVFGSKPQSETLVPPKELVREELSSRSPLAFTAEQWAVTAQDELIGVVSWQSSKTFADWIWIASSAETEGVLLDAFLPYWMNSPGPKRSLRLNFPKRMTNLSLEAHWFKPTRTLIWMKYQG